MNGIERGEQVSGIKLDIAVISEVIGQMQQLKRRIADAGSHVASTGVNGAVASRRSIGSRLSGTAQRLGRVEAALQQLHGCIEGAVDRYGQAESDIVRRSGQLTDIRVLNGGDEGWWSAARSAWNRDMRTVEAKVVQYGQHVSQQIKGQERLISLGESHVMRWFAGGERFVDEWLEKGVYNGEYKNIAEKWIDGTWLDNNYLHRAIDTADQGAQLASHFRVGAARGLTSTAFGLAEGVVLSAAELFKHRPMTEMTKATAYVVQTVADDKPLEKLGRDALQVMKQKAAEGQSVWESVKQGFADKRLQFEQGNLNEKADMLGFGTEQVAELFVGAVEVKSVLAARKAAMEAAMLRSRVIANIEQSQAAREASRFDEYVLNERKLTEDLDARRAAEGADDGPKIKSAKEVEIINQRGESLGELDEIDLVNKIFYEDKSAQGLNIVNPKTGLPAQTPQQFADKQILTKTRNRINELQNNATSTRATKEGSREIPELDSIKNIREFVFRLDGNTPELKQAVENSLNQLRKEFPDYKFSAIFGGMK